MYDEKARVRKAGIDAGHFRKIWAQRERQARFDAWYALNDWRNRMRLNRVENPRY